MRKFPIHQYIERGSQWCERPFHKWSLTHQQVSGVRTCKGVVRPVAARTPKNSGQSLMYGQCRSGGTCEGTRWCSVYSAGRGYKAAKIIAPRPHVMKIKRSGVNLRRKTGYSFWRAAAMKWCARQGGRAVANPQPSSRRLKWKFMTIFCRKEWCARVQHSALCTSCVRPTRPRSGIKNNKNKTPWAFTWKT